MAGTIGIFYFMLKRERLIFFKSSFFSGISKYNEETLVLVVSSCGGKPKMSSQEQDASSKIPFLQRRAVALGNCLSK